MCYIIRKYSWLLKITSKLLFPASKKSWNVILLSYVIIIFILCNRAKQNNFQKMNKKWWANREIFGVVSSENSYSALQQRHTYIGYRSTWNSCPIYTCEIFRLTPPKTTSLTIFFLRRSAYPLYSLYSILRPIWTGECKYPSLSYRFYDFYDRFHYTVEVRSHEKR